MALSSPTHRIHTIYGAFGNPFSFSQTSPSSLLSSPQASAFVHLPNVSLSPRGRGSGSASGVRTALASGTASSYAPQPWQTVTRPRRTSVVVPTSSRRAPPPPPLVRTSVVTVEDPFADSASFASTSPSLPLDLSRFMDSDEIMYDEPETLPPLLSPAPRAISSRTRISTLSYSGGAALQPQSLPPHMYSSAMQVDRERERGKLVASVLLSRASGRPMRPRVPRAGEAREYVKSGLSRVVGVEC